MYKIPNKMNKINSNNVLNPDFFDDPPGWANGEFNGTWGISLLGLPAVELGWVFGYFAAVGIFGRIEGYFAEWKDDEPVSYIAGYVIAYNMIGVVGNLTNTNESTFFMGLGAPNENGEFYYRISLFLGPNWYIMGTWREL